MWTRKQRLNFSTTLSILSVNHNDILHFFFFSHYDLVSPLMRFWKQIALSTLMKLPPSLVQNPMCWPYSRRIQNWPWKFSLVCASPINIARLGWSQGCHPDPVGSNAEANENRKCRRNIWNRLRSVYYNAGCCGERLDWLLVGGIIREKTILTKYSKHTQDLDILHIHKRK